MEHRSVWLATTERPQYPQLSTDLDVDVVVVGGGIVGLTTGLLAHYDGARVAVLEADQVGAGTSGRTTGKVTSQHSAVYASLLKRHGEDKTRMYAEANQTGMHLVAQLAQNLGIDCDLTWASAYAYTRQPRNRRKIEDEVEAAQSVGLPASLAHETELPFPIEAAVVFDDQVHFHAGRYLNGLAAAFTERGGQLFEGTRVTDVDEEDDGVRVRTADGAVVRADHVVLATLLPIRYAGGYFGKTRPTRSYGIAVRLRDDAPRGMGISIDSPTRSTRPWLDPGPGGMIVVGNDHQTGKGDTSTKFADLEQWTRSHFPVESVDYGWSSQDYTTPDAMPYIGRAQLTRRTLVATGFAKWGLSIGSAGALLLADILAGRDSPWLSAFDATRIGGPRAIAKLLKDNVQVGTEFVGGHLARLRSSSVEHLPPGQGEVVQSDGQTVGAYRDTADRVHAVGLTCTHLGCALSWNAAETSWDCSCHGSRFDVDGGILTGPAVTPLQRVDVDETTD